MHVNVPDDAGAGARTDIHPKVESSRLIHLAQVSLRAFGESHQLGRGLIISVLQPWYVRVRSDHYVAACIREQIENYEAELAAVDDKMGAIITGCWFIAEDTAAASFRRTH